MLALVSVLPRPVFSYVTWELEIVPGQSVFTEDPGKPDAGSLPSTLGG